jgi:hypothetical protein
MLPARIIVEDRASGEAGDQRSGVVVVRGGAGNASERHLDYRAGASAPRGRTSTIRQTVLRKRF